MTTAKLAEHIKFGFKRRISPVIQSERAECGLACLTMIAAFHGHRLSLGDIRRRFPISQKGVTLSRVIDIAAALKLDSRAIKVPLSETRKIRLPAILHWDGDHFVVLSSVGRRWVGIFDPACGEARVSWEDFAERFSGIALELTPSLEFAPAYGEPNKRASTLLANIEGITSGTIQVILYALALEFCVLLAPLYVQWTLDKVLVSSDRELLTVLSLCFLFLVLFQAGMGAIRSWAVNWISVHLGVQWISTLFGHMTGLPLDFFEKRHVGDIVSRFGSIEAMQRTLSNQFVSAFIDGLMSIATMALLVYYNAYLAVMVALAVGSYALVRRILFRSLRRHTNSFIHYGAKQQSVLIETLRGIQAIKLANRQSVRRGLYVNALVDSTNSQIRLQYLDIIFKAANVSILGCGRVALIWLGATLVLNGMLTAGMMIAIIAYVDQLATRAAALIDKWNEFRMLGLHFERVDEIASERAEDLGESWPERKQGAFTIELENVWFRYAEGEPWILKDCSFSCRSGESVAISGSSGAGKTTLAKILLGLLEPTRGRVLLNGKDIRQVGIAAFREMVSAVMQDDQLFSGSIAENISFFDISADQDRIELSAKRAHIHDDILKMQMGYSTLVGDMGSSLSGGQKQRVLIARALYRDPSILILDEATSHLDVIKEQLVNQTVQEMCVARIIIAHRPETIASADRTLFMKDGRLMEPSVLEDILASMEVTPVN